MAQDQVELAQTGVETADAPSRRLGHAPGLDGLRGLAVLLVVVGHTQIGFLPPQFGQRILDIVGGGFMGVDIFFVLSGFLITALLLNERSQNGRVWFGGFYARRALRLLPALYVLLGAYLIYTAVSGLPIAPARSMTIAGIFYVNNWYPVFHPLSSAPGLGHVWSLSVEEQFYLIWPATLLLLARPFRGRLLLPATCGLIVLVMVRRTMLWSANGPAEWIEMFVRTDNRADALLIGALAAMLWTRGMIKIRRRYLGGAAWVAVLGMVAMMWTCTPRSDFLYYGGFTLFAVAAAVVTIATVESAWSANWFFESRPMRLFGRVSYGLYLWHLPVYFAVIHYTTAWAPLSRFALAILVTAAGVAASWHFVERPAQRFRSRFHERPVTPAESRPRRILDARWMFVAGAAILALGLFVAYALPSTGKPLALPGPAVYPLSRPNRDFAALVGRTPAELVDANGSGLTALIVNLADYQNVDASAPLIPATVLRGAISGKTRVRIAVNVNGRIAAVADSGWTMLRTVQFRVLLPRSALRPGYNEVSIYSVLGSPEAPRLALIRLVTWTGLSVGGR